MDPVTEIDVCSRLLDALSRHVESAGEMWNIRRKDARKLLDLASQKADAISRRLERVSADSA